MSDHGTESGRGATPKTRWAALRTRGSRVRALIRKELRQLFRDPKTKRVIFVSPIIQLVLFGYAVNTDVRNVPTALVDHDRSALSRALVDAFTASSYFRIVTTSDDPSALRRSLDRGDAVVGLHIPPGFSADTRAGRVGRIQVLLDGGNSNTATVAQGYAQRIVQQFALEQAATAGAVPPGRVDLRARAWFNPSLESRVYNVPAVCGVIVLLMSLLLTAMGVVREREMGTLDQLLVSPLAPGELMLGKTIPVAAVAMAQLAIVVAVALLWFDIPLRGSAILLLAASALFILAGLSVGLWISTVSRTQQEAFLTMFLFILPAIILSGFLYPVDTMPELFQHLTMANPLRHYLEIVRGLFLKGSAAADLVEQLAILGAMAIVGLSTASWRFRRMLA